MQKFRNMHYIIGGQKNVDRKILHGLTSEKKFREVKWCTAVRILFCKNPSFTHKTILPGGYSCANPLTTAPSNRHMWKEINNWKKNNSTLF